MTQHPDTLSIQLVDDTLSNLTVAASLFEAKGDHASVMQKGEERLLGAALTPATAELCRDMSYADLALILSSRSADYDCHSILDTADEQGQ